ncbi:MAG: hypothetical protein ACLURV_12265 [Gallintestinimicrobium sp.]
MLDSISAPFGGRYLTELYLDFSGYCDMAIGLGKMIGLEVAEISMRRFTCFGQGILAQMA